jgi:NarL family two-component system response regulator LiaR
VSTPLSILIADDHALLRKTLRRCLEAAPDLSVVADVGSTDEAVREAERLNPDLVLLDVDMPGMVCFDAARLIKTRQPSVRIVFLSAFFHDRYIAQALAVGASGYITKNEPPEVLIDALRGVAAGTAYYSPQVRARIMIESHGVGLAPDVRPRAATLTEREVQVLQYIARGLSKREIADVLHLSERTVNCHTASLMAKLDIHDRVELARYAIREGLVEP